MNRLGQKEGGEAAVEERRRNGTKTLSLPLFNVDRHAVGRVLIDGAHPAQQNITRLKRDMAWVGWVGPTTTTTQVQETRRNRMQTTLHLPRQGLERPTNRISVGERPTGYLSRSDGSGDCREIGKEQWDAPCGLCRLRHE